MLRLGLRALRGVALGLHQ